jgi:hypothetical protein
MQSKILSRIWVPWREHSDRGLQSHVNCLLLLSLEVTMLLNCSKSLSKKSSTKIKSSSTPKTPCILRIISYIDIKAECMHNPLVGSFVFETTMEVVEEKGLVFGKIFEGLFLMFILLKSAKPLTLTCWIKPEAAPICCFL